ncbi:type 1 glutamine amidotransferase domain-containing protein [Thermococcus sp.]
MWHNIFEDEKMTKKVLIPIPDKDFDLTEVSIPWKYFVNNGFDVTFSTEKGKVGKADPLLITGVIFGKLGAKPEAIEAYRELEQSASFQDPIPYENIIPGGYDALILPGGHAKGMRQYLESTVLQEKVLEFVKLNKIIGAICHGPLVLARTTDPETGRSVLYGRKLTSLTKKLERMAYYLTFWKLGRYYRTYPEYVQDEIIKVLKTRKDYLTGGSIWKPFVVEHGNLITARWPNDVHLFAQTLVKRIKGL